MKVRELKVMLSRFHDVEVLVRSADWSKCQWCRNIEEFMHNTSIDDWDVSLGGCIEHIDYQLVIYVKGEKHSVWSK